MIMESLELMNVVRDNVRQRIDEAKASETKQKAHLTGVMVNYSIFKQVFD